MRQREISAVFFCENSERLPAAGRVDQNGMRYNKHNRGKMKIFRIGPDKRKDENDEKKDMEENLQCPAGAGHAFEPDADSLCSGSD